MHMERIVLHTMAYRDKIQTRNDINKIHFIKRHKLKKQIQEDEAYFQTYNAPDKIFDLVTGIYVLLSTIFYGKLEDMDSKNITISDNIVGLQIQDIHIWYIVKLKRFDIDELNLSYSVYKDKPIKNREIETRWNKLYPQIFECLYPFLQVQKESVKNARKDKSIRRTHFYKEENT